MAANNINEGTFELMTDMFGEEPCKMYLADLKNIDILLQNPHVNGMPEIVAQQMAANLLSEEELRRTLDTMIKLADEHPDKAREFRDRLTELSRNFAKLPEFRHEFAQFSEKVGPSGYEMMAMTDEQLQEAVTATDKYSIPAREWLFREARKRGLMADISEKSIAELRKMNMLLPPVIADKMDKPDDQFIRNIYAGQISLPLFMEALSHTDRFDGSNVEFAEYLDKLAKTGYIFEAAETVSSLRPCSPELDRRAWETLQNGILMGKDIPEYKTIDFARRFCANNPETAKAFLQELIESGININHGDWMRGFSSLLAESPEMLESLHIKDETGNGRGKIITDIIIDAAKIPGGNSTISSLINQTRPTDIDQALRDRSNEISSMPEVAKTHLARALLSETAEEQDRFLLEEADRLLSKTDIAEIKQRLETLGIDPRCYDPKELVTRMPAIMSGNTSKLEAVYDPAIIDRITEINDKSRMLFRLPEWALRSTIASHNNTISDLQSKWPELSHNLIEYSSAHPYGFYDLNSKLLRLSKLQPDDPRLLLYESFGCVSSPEVSKMIVDNFNPPDVATASIMWSSNRYYGDKRIDALIDYMRHQKLRSVQELNRLTPEKSEQLIELDIAEMLHRHPPRGDKSDEAVGNGLRFALVKRYLKWNPDMPTEKVLELCSRVWKAYGIDEDNEVYTEGKIAGFLSFYTLKSVLVMTDDLIDNHL